VKGFCLSYRVIHENGGHFCLYYWGSNSIKGGGRVGLWGLEGLLGAFGEEWDYWGHWQWWGMEEFTI